MNFAAPALLIILLLLPGVIARATYARGQWDTHPFRSGNLTDEIAFGAVTAIMLHAAWIFGAAKLGYSIRFDYLTSLLFGPGSGNPLFDAAVRSCSQQAGLIVSYNSSLYVGAWALGYVAHAIVRAGRVDRQSGLFRFQHDWHYLFSGEILDFGRPGGPWEADKYQGSWIAVLIDQGTGSFVYRGILRRYHFDSEGRLDRIVLIGPERAELDEITRLEGENASSEAAFKSINASFFVIYIRDVKNINIKYFSLSMPDRGAR